MSDVEKVIVDNTGLVYHQLHKFNLAYNEDAISYAMEALWKAASTYDESRNCKFSTYASTCIYNGIMMYLRVHSKEQLLDTVSLEAELNEDGLTYVDLIAGADDIELEQFSAINKAINRAIANTHNEKHKEVVIKWIESNFEVTQKELAEMLGISQAQVSRILSIFKNKLKKELEGSI